MLYTINLEGHVQETTVTVPEKELRELRKSLFVLKGLFDASFEYAERLSPTDMTHHGFLLKSLEQGQVKAQKTFDKAKQLENQH